jgi:fatty acid desaturase
LKQTQNLAGDYPMITVGQEIRELSMHELAKVNSRAFAIRVLIYVALVSGLIALTVILPGAFAVIPAILLGVMYGHAVELQHQTLHSTGFATRWLNRLVGVPLGMPLLVSFSDYQHSHLRHHRLLGTPEDKEFFNYGYESLTTIRTLIPHLLMLRHYRDVARYMFQSIFGGFTRENAKPQMVGKIRTEYRLFVLFILAMVAVTVIFKTTLFLWIWAIPLVIGVPVHALIELPEHIGCDTGTIDVLKNTRTIHATWLGNWFTNGNNYHVEHHWLPGVPNNKWPELHRRIAKDIKHLESSYASFYWKFFSMLRKNAFGGKNTGTRAKAKTA